MYEDASLPACPNCNNGMVEEYTAKVDGQKARLIVDDDKMRFVSLDGTSDFTFENMACPDNTEKWRNILKAMIKCLDKYEES